MTNSAFESKLKSIFESSPVIAQNTNSEKLIGGLGDGRKIEEFDPIQVIKGIQVEMEHTQDIKSVLEIVMDHLTEDPIYYDKLATIENN